MRRRFYFPAVGAVLIWLILAGSAHSQNAFPSKPIQLVVPFPPGGVVDPVARLMAPLLSKALGQPVVVENRAGAGGALAAAAVARAEPDGHTALLHTSVVTMHPHTLKNAGYDPRRDLVPVSLIGRGPYVIAVNPLMPVRTVAELIAFTKANPGKVFYGSAGNGSATHLIGELFNGVSGAKMIHVPYKGNGPMMTAIAGGEIQVGFDTIPGSKALSESGKVRTIAVTSKSRNPAAPDLPSMAEAGMSGFEVTLWEAVFLPRGTPDAIVARWNSAILEALQSPELKNRLVALGFDVGGSTPRQLQERIEVDIAKWAEVIKRANISAE